MPCYRIKISELGAACLSPETGSIWRGIPFQISSSSDYSAPGIHIYKTKIRHLTQFHQPDNGLIFFALDFDNRRHFSSLSRHASVFISKFFVKTGTFEVWTVRHSFFFEFKRLTSSLAIIEIVTRRKSVKKTQPNREFKFVRRLNVAPTRIDRSYLSGWWNGGRYLIVFTYVISNAWPSSHSIHCRSLTVADLLAMLCSWRGLYTVDRSRNHIHSNILIELIVVEREWMIK